MVKHERLSKTAGDMDGNGARLRKCNEGMAVKEWQRSTLSRASHTSSPRLSFPINILMKAMKSMNIQKIELRNSREIKLAKNKKETKKNGNGRPGGRTSREMILRVCRIRAKA